MEKIPSLQTLKVQDVKKSISDELYLRIDGELLEILNKQIDLDAYHKDVCVDVFGTKFKAFVKEDRPMTTNQQSNNAKSLR